MTLPTSPPVLGSRFAQDLPELSLPWQAEAAPEPRLLALDEQVALELGLDVGWLRSEEGVAFLLGTAVPAGATPVAQAYAGHQFGGYSPRLGDGRALLLGDLPGADGQRRDLHLKGSGRTPFSRGGDGRAVVGPMLREHVMSTAMHALGVPTTRSLAVVATGRSVAREDGALPGALLARVASSHLRVGSFQYARALEDVPLLRRLLGHAVALHHPEAADAEVPALALYEGVLQAQAELVARWMHLGFVHGVMNTDNVTISGETIDYGPCAFLDAYDPAAVYSSIDQGGRYAYGNQPSVTAWNLARFAESLLPLLAEDPEEAIEVATAALGSFPERYAQAFVDQARPRLGLRPLAEGGPDDDVVRPLVEDLLTLLREARPDHTGFWRDLAVDARGGATPARDRVLDLAAYDAWAARWHALGPDADLVARTNPAVVPRNHVVEAALEAATAGDLGPVERLLEVLRRPYDPRPEDAAYLEPAPADFGGYTTYCGT